MLLSEEEFFGVDERPGDVLKGALLAFGILNVVNKLAGFLSGWRSC